MPREHICEQIAKQTEELFECSLFREYIRIETPFIYPDGDIIDLFYKKTSSREIITDLGGASNWVGLQSISESRTKKQEEQIEYVCKAHGVELEKGEFFINLNKANKPKKLVEAVFDLGQAIIKISSLVIFM